MLPLYKGAQGTQKGEGFHAGLWYDRFFDQYDKDCKVADAGKSNWIKTVAGSTGDGQKLDAFAARQEVLLEACGGQSLVMRTDWHFVTGMGNNHPVENGFAWHHTLGVPYLTGAAVKGMVRAWCEVWEGFDEATLKQWFGDTKKSGELIFFDAVPIAPVQLKADIMTPHYGKWYAEGESLPNRPDTIPADWHDPVPVPFLVVDKASFQFAVSKRTGSDIQLKEVTEALAQALEWLGAGAKTAVGYGRFSEDKQARLVREKKMCEQAQAEQQEKEKAEQEAKRATMSPLEADLDRWRESSPEPNTVAAWLEQMEQMDRQEDRQCIAQAMKDYYEQRGTWKKPSKKQKPNVQRIKACLNA